MRSHCYLHCAPATSRSTRDKFLSPVNNYSSFSHLTSLYGSIRLSCIISGGIRDTDDVSFTECALRETEEEIGIKRDQITIWGETKLCYPTKGPGIMPVVGCIENYDPALLRINTLEVARVFTIPISLLCSNKQHTQFKSNYSLPVFTCPGTVERVWGITAVITDVFLRSLVSSDIYDNRIKFISKYTCIR